MDVDRVLYSRAFLDRGSVLCNEHADMVVGIEPDDDIDGFILRDERRLLI